MPEILFNGFSFLQKKLKEKGLEFSNVKIDVPEGSTVDDLIEILDLVIEDVEAVFINGKAGRFSDVLKNDDRIALIPPGTPGPHRLLLGIRPRE